MLLTEAVLYQPVIASCSLQASAGSDLNRGCDHAELALVCPPDASLHADDVADVQERLEAPARNTYVLSCPLCPLQLTDGCMHSPPNISLTSY